MTQVSMPPSSGAFPPPPPPVLPSTDRTLGGGTIFGALNALLRHRALVLACATLLGLAAGTWAFSRERVYSSASSFMPEGRQSAATGLAAQLGLVLPGTGGTESAQFYADLLKTREILGAAVTTAFTIPGSIPRATTLVDLYRVKGRTPALRREAAIERLDDDLDISISTRTNVVTVRVTASSPELAQRLNQRLLDLLGEFNLRRRQSRASEERRFAEARVSSVKGELRVAEDRLQSFLQSNRDYQHSPSLVFSYERLQADVMLLRQVVTTLQQSAEQAKIEEVRDTPTVTLVEGPGLPVRPDPRGIVKFTLIGLVLGTFLGMGLAFVRETVSRPEVRATSDYEEFARLRREALSDLRHPWRALRRSRAGRPEPPG